jgi:hypothetical protein
MTDRHTHTHTDTHTHRHTHTDTQTLGHQFFYCFIVFRDLNNVQKSHKKWGYKIFIFRMNSILRHSNASRSNSRKLGNPQIYLYCVRMTLLIINVKCK